jgi:DNA-binding transcriptional LysR family regulator
MNTVLEVEHLATVTGLVQAGLGITVVPALTLFQFDRPDLVMRPVDVRGLRRRVLLVRRRAERLSLAAQALHDLMMERKPLVEQPRGRRRAARPARSSPAG